MPTTTAKAMFRAVSDPPLRSITPVIVPALSFSDFALFVRSATQQPDRRATTLEPLRFLTRSSVAEGGSWPASSGSSHLFVGVALFSRYAT